MHIALMVGLTGLGLADAVGAVAPPDPENTIAPILGRTATDAAWSWHLQKTAIYDAVRDRIYSGAVSIDAGTGPVGSQWILEFDGSTGGYLTRHLVNTGYVADDHNAPALWIEGGRLICGLAGHGDAAEIKVAWSSDTGSVPAGGRMTP